MLRTTYRRQGGNPSIVEFDYYEKRREENGFVTVLGWGTFGPSSVLAGQASKHSLSTYETEELANEAMREVGIDPAEVNWNSKWIEPQISLNHLPDTPDW